MKISEIIREAEEEHEVAKNNCSPFVDNLFLLFIQLALHTLQQQERITALELKLKEVAHET